jgi:hypothetical protein
MVVFIGGVRQCCGRRLAREAHLLGWPTMQLGRAAKFSCSTAFPTLDTPLTDILRQMVKTDSRNAPGPGRSAKGVGPAGPNLGRLGLGLVPRRSFVSYCS